MKKILMMASVASMIDLFNMENIHILQKMGHEVHVACNFQDGNITSPERIEEFKKELVFKDIKFYDISVPRNITSFKEIKSSYVKLKNICESEKYDLVHCHSPIGGVIARLACKNMRKNGTKVIYTAHGFHFYKNGPIKNWIIFYPIEKLFSKYTDLLITINQEDFEISKKFKASEYRYVPGIGVDIERIQNLNINKIEKKKELGLKKENFIIFTVGQISKRKNQEVLIKALSKIEDKNIILMISGFGELEDYLKELVADLNLKERVIFTGYRPDINEILNVVDLFAFPSLQEGLPASLMEAMAAGLPVVVSKIRGNSDLVIENKGGVLVLNNEEEQYVRAINFLHENPEIRKSFGDFNKARMTSFSKEKVSTLMKKLYREILE